MKYLVREGNILHICSGDVDAEILMEVLDEVTMEAHL